MQWQTELERDQAFLREQIAEVDRKITRLRHACGVSRDSLETEGLDKLMQAAQAERELLIDLLDYQSGGEALSLDVLIMQHAETYRREAQRLGRNWGQGETTPPGYWEAESKYTFLTDLLRRFHAWQAGRPLYPPADKPSSNGTNSLKHMPGKPIHPWYTGTSDEPRCIVHTSPAASSKEDTPASQRDALLASLRRINFPDHHLELIVQPDGIVYVTGFAHSENERDEALAVLFEHDETVEVMVDIKVVPQAVCPVCSSQRSPAL